MAARLDRVELNRSGVAQLLKSGPILADVSARAGRIAARAGSGMVASSMVGRTRARASVITADREARQAEATYRSLTASIDAGR